MVGSAASNPTTLIVSSPRSSFGTATSSHSASRLSVPPSTDPVGSQSEIVVFRTSSWFFSYAAFSVSECFPPPGCAKSSSGRPAAVIRRTVSPCRRAVTSDESKSMVAVIAGFAGSLTSTLSTRVVGGGAS